MQRQLATALLAASALSFALPAHAAEDPASAWSIVADFTTEIGPRPAGSPQEAKARDWAVARLKALGFANVKNEPFTVRGYVRGTDKARLVAPYDQPLAVTALGYSGTTSEQGVTADVVYFASLDALNAAPAGSLTGKIAFVDHAMKANQDGSGYGPYGNVRRQGPAIASRKGAVGIVIRSIGTDSHRNPHTGGTNFPAGVTPIPAGAVSNPDADLIARVAASGKTMRINLVLTGHTQDGLPSGNVIADLPGRDPSLPMILVGCHLDSWDLGTGAIDDGAGCAIITDAALATWRKARPLRTIRVLWAGSEEIGGFGGEAYAATHPEAHALAMESDFGADRLWNIKFKLANSNAALSEKIKAAVSPMGIVYSPAPADGGTDVEPVIAKQKLAVVDLWQDGTRYFDLHHTPDDTLDKIDPAQLKQNVEAWKAVLDVVASEAGPISGE